ncbi:MAG: phosphoglycerate mutase family protein, partial [Paramuribaculum sp.]|nr:phosphoglycerate mutase family protein [Paramuribaculum sp.]
VMTAGKKDTILRLKLQAQPEKEYHGVEYYEAVIADGITCMNDFEQWVIDHRKKPPYYWIP